MKILLLCTRDPTARSAGRTAVLRTAVGALRSLGHSVDLFVIAPIAPSAEGTLPGVGQITRVTPPSLARATANVITYFLPGRLSLNECLFFSQRIRGQVMRAVARGGYDLVVADMVRAAPLVDRLDVPVVLDLDDRLSERYQAIVTAGRASPELLGIYGPRIPTTLRPLVTRVARRMLARESRVLGRREVALARRCAAASMVSAHEAERLARDAGVPVTALPMAVWARDRGVAVGENPGEHMVFSGGMDYHANAEAARWFCQHVLPLVRDSLPEFTLTIVGFCPPAIASELDRPGVRLTGYVNDLGVELGRHRAFLAPLRSGGGIKTKVLDAFALGLPVVTTSWGSTGLDVDPGVECLRAETAEEFAASVLHLAGSAPDAARIGEAGRAFVAQRFSLTRIAESWRDVLERVTETTDSTNVPAPQASQSGGLRSAP